jgi:hypothetical protein
VLRGEPLQFGGSHWRLVAGTTVQPVQAALTALAEVVGNPGTIVEFLHRFNFAMLRPISVMRE